METLVKMINDIIGKKVTKRANEDNSGVLDLLIDRIANDYDMKWREEKTSDIYQERKKQDEYYVPNDNQNK